MAKGSRAGSTAGVKDRRGMCDPGATRQSRVEVYLEEYGGTTVGIRPK